METIFDYNPTKEEMARFGIKPEYGNVNKQIESMKKMNLNSNDDNLYQLGLLFAIRGNKEKAFDFWRKIKNKDILCTLVQDF